MTGYYSASKRTYSYLMSKQQDISGSHNSFQLQMPRLNSKKNNCTNQVLSFRWTHLLNDRPEPLLEPLHFVAAFIYHIQSNSLHIHIRCQML